MNYISRSDAVRMMKSHLRSTKYSSAKEKEAFRRGYMEALADMGF
jgi:hypothetical protein